MKTFKIILVILLISAVATTGIQLLETIFGAVKVFFGAVCLIPVLFVWSLIATHRATKRN